MELRLKEIRKAAGYTQKELAEALGADLKTVGNCASLLPIKDKKG